MLERREWTNPLTRNFHSRQEHIEYNFLQHGDHECHKRIDQFMENIMPKHSIRFNARVDYICGGHIWEFKCCHELTIEHFLQVVIYAWLWRMTDKEREIEKNEYGTNNCIFHLFNIRTNEHYELCASEEELSFVMERLIKNKYFKPPMPVDSSFVENCMKELSKIYIF